MAMVSLIFQFEEHGLLLTDVPQQHVEAVVDLLSSPIPHELVAVVPSVIEWRGEERHSVADFLAREAYDYRGHLDLWRSMSDAQVMVTLFVTGDQVQEQRNRQIEWAKGYIEKVETVMRLISQ